MKLLQLLLDTSGNKELAAALLSLGTDNFSQDQIRYMAGPVVVYPSPWSQDLPDWLFKAVYTDRLEQILTEAETGVTGELATESEVVAHMYGATMDAPLGHDWSQIYLWCGNKTFTKHHRLTAGRTFWEMIGAEPVQLSDYQRTEFLESLQRDLRRTVVKVAARQGVAKPQTRRSGVSQPKGQVSDPSDKQKLRV